MLETSEKIESFINKCRITKNQTESLKELKNITTKKKKKKLNRWAQNQNGGDRGKNQLT